MHGLIRPALDPNFQPMVVVYRAYQQEAEQSGVRLVVAIERCAGQVSAWESRVFPDGTQDERTINVFDRVVKTLLWARGGYRIKVSGHRGLYEHLKKAYTKTGSRAFDEDFMANVYEQPFEVVYAENPDDIAHSVEGASSVGRHLDGCRIGFDAGGSDRKVSAVIDGEAVFSKEVVWFPKTNDNPDYHYQSILSAMKEAADHMPRVDAIGVSSAGVYIDNRIMVASLFLKVPKDLFDLKVKDMYINLAREIGDVPLVVANDGDVTALAGAMSLNAGNVLGIAMGTSEAGGYVDHDMHIMGWLNELAFVPVDFNPGAMADEWSGDIGCGVKYFSQDAVIKLAPAAGIHLEESLSPAEKLKIVQTEMERGNPEAIKLYETIGVYFGYAIAYYALFYEIDHVLIMGRVTSGEGGTLLLDKAREVLKKDFPEIYTRSQLHIPDEKSRRVGQSVAAASLPEIQR